MLDRFGSATAALRALPDLARRGGGRRPIRIAGRAAAEQELAAVEAAGARLVALCEPDYPRLLRAIDDAPPLLCLKGFPHLAHGPCLAVVGARNASALAVRFTREIVTELGAAGLTIVSGLARGIDAAAHSAALPVGTVAVLAGGVDIVYPPENAALQEAIAERGLLVAEMPAGTVPQARHFPRRNRLISGLSLGVLVVEAAPQSGSLITARMALEQGRDVLAVPGSPLDPRARGCNELIRNGAVLVERAADVLAVIRTDRPLAEPGGTGPSPPPAPLDEASLPEARARLAGLLGASAVEVDELIRQAGLAAAAVQTVLLEWELAGRLQRHPGNMVSWLYRDDAIDARS